MTDEAAFIEEIRRIPDDMTPRLIYADFLEDRGDPRGEFIRVQCELSEMPAGTPGRSDLMNRERELLETFGGEWLQPLKQLGVKGLTFRSFERGLLERVRIGAAEYHRNWQRLLELTPALQHLNLRFLRDLEESQFRTLTFPDQIVSLDISAGQMNTETLYRLTTSLATAKNINLLNVSSNPVGAAAFAALPLTQIVSLKAGYCGITGQNLSEQLVRMDSGAGLERLTERMTEIDLQCNTLTGHEGFAIANYQWSQLRHLNVASCELSSLQRFADSSRFPLLQSLIFRNNRVSDWPDQSSETMQFLERLQVLDLRGTPLSTQSHGI